MLEFLSSIAVQAIGSFVGGTIGAVVALVAAKYFHEKREEQRYPAELTACLVVVTRGEDACVCRVRLDNVGDGRCIVRDAFITSSCLTPVAESNSRRINALAQSRMRVRKGRGVYSTVYAVPSKYTVREWKRDTWKVLSPNRPLEMDGDLYIPWDASEKHGSVQVGLCIRDVGGARTIYFTLSARQIAQGLVFSLLGRVDDVVTVGEIPMNQTDKSGVRIGEADRLKSRLQSEMDKWLTNRETL